MTLHSNILSYVPALSINIFISCTDNFVSSWFWISGEMNLTSLRLSKALMVPETSTVYEVFRRMAVCRVDALFLTDSNGNL